MTIPRRFFARRVHRIRRQAPDAAEVADAAALLKRRRTADDHRRRRRAVFRRGGGTDRLRRGATPSRWSRPSPGRANMLATHPLNIGPIGVTGSDSANAIAEEADVILAVGTRLQDFTTGSWTAFARTRGSSA
jgi:3D-(3,5/4)-trihydroxycyclohexane-1,2-dione acylhydrolase (decyclizing)